MKIFHLVPDEEWQATSGAEAYSPPSLSKEGFIHFSEQRQLLRSAEKYFKGRDDLLIICVDASKLQAELRFDPVEQDRFPHLYGPLNFDAVEAVVAFARGADGKFLLPDELRG